MKKMIYVKMVNKFLIFFLTFLMSFCSLLNGSNPSPLTVTVSIPPYMQLVQDLGQEWVQVTSLLPETASPEHFEPTWDQLKQFGQADLHFGVGNLPFEAFFESRLKSLNPDCTWISVSDIKKDIDPHSWMSPQQFSIHATQIATILKSRLPTAKKQIDDNLKIVLKRLDKLDQKLRNTIKSRGIRYVLIYHPSVGQLAHDYGLTQLGIEAEGKPPTIRQMEAMIQTAKSNQVPSLFYTHPTEKILAKRIAKQVGANLVQINPLSLNYDKNMNHFIESL